MNDLALPTGLATSFKLTADQAQVFSHPAQVKFVAAPRMWGKDTLTLYTALFSALEGRHVFCNMPSHRLGVNAMRVLFNADAKAYGFEFGKTHVQCPNGAVITFQSVADSTRKIHPYGSVMLYNEMQESKLHLRTIRHNTMMRDGRALILGTPNIVEEGQEDVFRSSYYDSFNFSNCAGWNFHRSLHSEETHKEVGLMYGMAYYRSQMLAEFVVLEKEGAPALPHGPYLLGDRS